MFIPQGHRLVKSGTFTQANARLSLVDGTAFFDCGADLSAYAGLDTGSHEYLIKVYDNDGNSIQGYVGAVGGGEAFGAELGGAWTNQPGNPFETWTPGVGSAITQAINTTSYGVAYKSADSPQGALMKIIATVNFASGSLLYGIGPCTGPGLGPTLQEPGISITTTTAGHYGVVEGTDRDTLSIMTNGAVNFSLADLSYKRLTDCAVTGFHIISAQGGSTQNWQNVSGPFCYNDSAGYSWKLYKVR